MTRSRRHPRPRNPTSSTCTSSSTAYYAQVPDLSRSRSSGSSSARAATAARPSTRAFNETHIAAITQAIVEYRTGQGITGPLFIGARHPRLTAPGRDDRARGARGERRARARRRVRRLRADARAQPRDHRATTRGRGTTASRRPTASSSRPSHNPPRDGGFKYNPPHGGPADCDATNWIADRANELIEDGNRDVKHGGAERASTPTTSAATTSTTSTNIIDFDAIKRVRASASAPTRSAARASTTGALIAERYGLDLTVVNPLVDPHVAFMTLDWDGKIRMDPSSPSRHGIRRRAPRRLRHPHRQRRRRRPPRHRHPRRRPDEPQPLPRRRHPVPLHAPRRAGARMPRSARRSSRVR